ncbi:MAG: protein kinase, partial [Planctomycetes bacterium]|nr:protein kinase [Planctomycetota bacterium]
MLRPELASDDRARTRFRREARIAARLQHPSIAPVFDVSDQGDGVLFYSMKLVRGRTLAWALEAASERVPELLEVFLRVCQGMAHAHDSGVVHRDLKPS